MVVVISFFGFLRPDLSPGAYMIQMFSGCIVSRDNKETELEISKNEASPSAGTNAMVVLVPCRAS